MGNCSSNMDFRFSTCSNDSIVFSPHSNLKGPLKQVYYPLNGVQKDGLHIDLQKSLRHKSNAGPSWLIAHLSRFR